MATPLSHEALLTLAYRLEADAADGERDRVEATARRLLDAVFDHVGAERIDLMRLPDAGAALARGQQRMLEALVELVQSTSATHLAPCDELAQEFIALLTLQAEDERRSLARSVR